MEAHRRRELELNELEWWRNWAELDWMGRDAYLFRSSEMPEVFFNRGGFLNCEPSDKILSGLETRLQESGRNPAIMIYESCSELADGLAKAGYRKADVMTVMQADGKLGSKTMSPAVTDQARDAGDWARGYLMAFYGDLKLMSSVEKAVRRAQKLDSTTLLEARIGGEMAGVLAVFRTPGLAGVYCVGTIERYRRRGVAEVLLARAGEIAEAEGRTLVLQTLESDGSEPYYARRGFRVLYRKLLLQKKS